jgi:hypothetical protein
LLGFAVSFFVVLLAVGVHYEGLRLCSRLLLQMPPQRFSVAMYFSTVNYTSLGVGDVVPVGNMRQLASLEAVTGLVMIAWTASFSFVQMEHFWEGK